MDRTDRNNLVQGLNTLKRHIFYELLNLVGRVFILVRYHEDVKIGKRGFLPEEKEKGIVLVFNHNMHFQWHDWGIEARLVFSGSMEHCLIPVEHIIAIYSPEANTQFVSVIQPSDEGTREQPPEQSQEDHQIEQPSGEDTQEKVIKLDFRKKR